MSWQTNRHGWKRERAASVEGWDRPGRRIHRSYDAFLYDDHRQVWGHRSWKRHRRTQYR